MTINNGLIDTLQFIDSASGNTIEAISEYFVSPKTLFAPSKIQASDAADKIFVEMEEQVAQLNRETD